MGSPFKIRDNITRKVSNIKFQSGGKGMKRQIIVKGGCGHSSREMAESGAALGLCVLGGFGLIIGTVAIVALAAIFKG